jgi:hypothetical protein
MTVFWVGSFANGYAQVQPDKTRCVRFPYLLHTPVPVGAFATGHARNAAPVAKVWKRR